MQLESKNIKGFLPRRSKRKDYSVSEDLFTAKEAKKRGLCRGKKRKNKGIITRTQVFVVK